MKNRKRNTLLMVAIAAIAFAAFSFSAPEVNSNNRTVATTSIMHQVAFPADMISAKCGDEASKTNVIEKKADTTKTVKSKCGEGKYGSKDAKVEKKADTTKKAESKCGQGKCGVS